MTCDMTVVVALVSKSFLTCLAKVFGAHVGLAMPCYIVCAYRGATNIACFVLAYSMSTDFVHLKVFVVLVLHVANGTLVFLELKQKHTFL